MTCAQTYRSLDLVWQVDPGTGSIHRLLFNPVKDRRISAAQGAQRLSSGSAVAYSENLLRLTYIDTPFWTDAIDNLHDLAAGAGSWSVAPQIVYHHIGVWYVWDGRGGTDRDGGSEQAAYFADAAPSYRLAGPARNMYFANFVGEEWIWEDLYWRVEAAGAGFHFIDLGRLLQSKLSEFQWEHIGPFLGLWQWFILLNSLPDAVPVLQQSEHDKGCQESAWFGNGCVHYSDGQATVGRHDCAECNCNSLLQDFDNFPPDCANNRCASPALPTPPLLSPFPAPLREGLLLAMHGERSRGQAEDPFARSLRLLRHRSPCTQPSNSPHPTLPVNACVTLVVLLFRIGS